MRRMDCARGGQQADGDQGGYVSFAGKVCMRHAKLSGSSTPKSTFFRVVKLGLAIFDMTRESDTNTTRKYRV
jgi:hypothetical protein